MSTENKKAGANGNGRLMVEELSLSCDDVKNDRQRFEIELKEGETTIVSWTQLRIDSGLPLDSPSSPPSPQRPNRIHQEHGLRSKCSNIVLKKETDEHNYCQPKKQRTCVSEVLEEINVVEATNNKKRRHGRVKSITSTSHINGGHSLDNARIELPDLNVPYTVQSAGTLPTHIKVESDSMTHGSMLENAILEMETMVADCKHSSQGRISDEVIFRLTSILGHWLKPRALKRCLRDMVPSDLSACRGDAARFIQFKKEVIEMIKLRNPSMATKVH
uniref:Uncharacterized protein n=1 Tax=Tanacetum cinerariifolium TaxID=118510 RepID=A0A6L2KGZ4_TANCI|nr:hypothetical protein [Tanacetum cinerariifolium]